jgi:hypothetical protein
MGDTAFASAPSGDELLLQFLLKGAPELVEEKKATASSTTATATRDDLIRNFLQGAPITPREASQQGGDQARRSVVLDKIACLLKDEQVSISSPGSVVHDEEKDDPFTTVRDPAADVQGQEKGTAIITPENKGKDRDNLMSKKAQKPRKARNTYDFEDYTYRCPTGVYFRCEQCTHEEEITEWLFLKNGHQWCLHMGKFHRCGGGGHIKGGESATFKTYKCSKKCLPDYAADWSTIGNDTAKKLLRTKGLFKVEDVASRPTCCPPTVAVSVPLERSRKKKSLLEAVPAENGHTTVEDINQTCCTLPPEHTSPRIGKRKKTMFPIEDRDHDCNTRSTPAQDEHANHVPLKKRHVESTYCSTPSDNAAVDRLEEQKRATKNKKQRERELAEGSRAAIAALSKNGDDLRAKKKHLLNEENRRPVTKKMTGESRIAPPVSCNKRLKRALFYELLRAHPMTDNTLVTRYVTNARLY